MNLFKFGLLFVVFVTCFICVFFILNYKNNIKNAENIVKNEFSREFDYKAEYTTGNVKKNEKELKILVLGNSISSGVIVSNIKDDYVNVLIRKISVKQNNRLVRARVYNLANFERYYSDFDYNILNPLIEYNPDIIIFQLGENYLRENDELYFKRFVKLINIFGDNNIKIVTSPYWGQRRKNKLNEKAALVTNSFYVDISNLFVYDKKTRADYKKKFSDMGLGMHPGEYGMSRIAEEIFITINALIVNHLI